MCSLQNLDARADWSSHLEQVFLWSRKFPFVVDFSERQHQSSLLVCTFQPQPAPNETSRQDC